MQGVRLAGTTSPGDVAFLPGAVPQLVVALPSPAQVPAVLFALCPSVTAEVAAWHHQTLPPAAEPPPSLSQPPLPAPRWLQPPGNAVGC